VLIKEGGKKEQKEKRIGEKGGVPINTIQEERKKGENLPVLARERKGVDGIHRVRGASITLSWREGGRGSALAPIFIAGGKGKKDAPLRGGRRKK